MDIPLLSNMAADRWAPCHWPVEDNGRKVVKLCVFDKWYVGYGCAVSATETNCTTLIMMEAVRSVLVKEIFTCAWPT